MRPASSVRLLSQPLAGNENYGHWEPPYGDYNVTGQLYGEAFNYVTAAMKDKFPDVKIGAVVTYEENVEGSNAQIANWTADVLQSCGEAADFFILHDYFYDENSDNVTNQDLLGTLDHLATIREGFDSMCAKYAPNVATPAPIALTEYNIAYVSKGGCGATMQFINTVWTAEFLGRVMLKREVDAALQFAFVDKTQDCSHTSRGLVGDLGVFDSTASLTEPRPDFYAHAVFNKAFGSSLLNTTSSSSTVKVFGSRFEGGELGLVVVNENAADAWLSITLSELDTASVIVANAWVATPGDSGLLNSTTAIWQGVSAAYSTANQSLQSYSPYAMNVTAHEGVLSFAVPSTSVNGIVLYV